MIDLRATIKPKSDQLNADDLIAGPLTIRIADVQVSAGEQPVAIHFDGDGGKPYKPGKAMRRVLVAAWGADGAAYIGRSLTLYRDEDVMFGGVLVGGIRISHLSHLNKPLTMALAFAKSKRKPFTVQPLAQDKAADGVRALLARIQAGEDVAADEAVMKQRAWLAKNRPELAAEVDAAIQAAQKENAT